MTRCASAFLTLCLVLGGGCVGELDGPEDEEESGERLPQSETRSYQVVVLGGGAAGVGAAIAAARGGARVILVAELPRLGGMISSGVSRTDLGTIGEASKPSPSRAHATNGLFEELRRRLAKRYASYSPLYASGLVYEPDVAAEEIGAMVHATAGLDLLTGYRLQEQGGVLLAGSRVTGILVQNGVQSIRLDGNVFIDATEAGDLIGKAGSKGIDWVVGREYRSATGESLAPDLPGSGDALVQAYNFRVTVQVYGAPVAKPVDYDQNLARYQQAAAVEGNSCTFSGKAYHHMWIQACLPNGKMDLNLDLIGQNHAYPTGSYATRQQIHEKLKRFALGWIYYLRTHGRPELGLSVNDYDFDGHFPPVLYVREARRSVGVVVFAQKHAVTTAYRPPLRSDSIAVGDYGADSHCLKTTNDPGGFYCGAFPWTATKPYQVPWGVLLPKRLEGLLVPHAVSATHVGYSTLRMEPVRMNLGQAAGTAAALAVRAGVAPRAVPVRSIQLALARDGQALMYFDDLPSTHSAFSAIQGLVARGALEGDGARKVNAGDAITRGQLCKVAVKALGIAINTSGGPHFSDVRPDHPFYAYIETLARRGVVSGYTDGTFQPSVPINRAALAKIAVLSSGLPVPGAGQYIEALVNAHIVDPASFSSPYAEASRGLAAVVVDGVARKMGH